MLGDLTGKTVLDLYAGTGALGIEALSRGAAKAVFVEAARGASDVLRDNLSRLALTEPSAVIVGTRVERAGPKLVAHAPFDIVFCDPPWRMLPEAVRALKSLLVEMEPASLPRLRVEGGLEATPSEPAHAETGLARRHTSDAPPSVAPPSVTRLILEHPARVSSEILEGLPWPIADQRAWGDTGVSVFELPGKTSTV
jgi:hypothetical protein